MFENDLANPIMNPSYRPAGPAPAPPPSSVAPAQPSLQDVLDNMSLLENIRLENLKKVRNMALGALALALVLGAVLSYFLYDLNQTQRIQAEAAGKRLGEIGQALKLVNERLEGNAGQIASLQSQMEVTMNRVGVTQKELQGARAVAARLKEEQDRNVQALSQEIAGKASAERLAGLESEAGQKFAGVNKDISAVKEDIKSNKQELSALGVKVDAQGKLIATNSTGIQELVRRGERDIATFDLQKKARQQVAGVGLELRDANPKGQKVNLRVYVNDTTMDRDHVNINTPINFFVYLGSERVPYELVINEVQRDRTKGYISLPKGKLAQGRTAVP